MLCYCNSKSEYNQCCERFINGAQVAETAEQLMRSRYSAYAVADVNYLLKSHHKTTRPIKDRNSILNWTKSVNWMGLEIIAKEKGTISDSEGMVEFKALYEENGRLECIHEKSFFVKEQGTWFYKSGTHRS